MRAPWVERKTPRIRERVDRGGKEESSDREMEAIVALAVV